jgi:hypothetical protein
MKLCSSCKIEKDVIHFHKLQSASDGLQYKCKECIKLYYQNNREYKLEYIKEYNKKNALIIKEKKQIFYQKYKEELKVEQQIYRDTHVEQKKKYFKEYRQKKFAERDPSFYLPRYLRTRLHHAVKGNFKTGSAIKALGCSIEELKLHLQTRFESGMTWDNYGAWHIDHIKPLASFDLTDREQLLQVCNYKNLQPLWAKDNLSKGCTDASKKEK